MNVVASIRKPMDSDVGNVLDEIFGVTVMNHEILFAVKNQNRTLNFRQIAFADVVVATISVAKLRPKSFEFFFSVNLKKIFK